MRDAVRVAVLQPADELLEEKPRLVLAEAALAADALEELAAGGVLHDDGEVRGGEEALDESDHVGVVQQTVVHELALDVVVDLIAALDVLDGEELAARLVTHELGRAEVALAQGLGIGGLVLGVVLGDAHGRHGEEAGVVRGGEARWTRERVRGGGAPDDD